MSYPKYFKPGQKIQLRPLAPAPAPGQVELLTSYLDDQGKDIFRLRLPYGTNAQEQYTFKQEMTLELSSESMGIGLKMTGEVVDQPQPHQIQVRLNHDLQAFQRRNQPRIDLQLDVRLNHSRGNLQSMRTAWQKNVDLIANCKDFSSIDKFNTIGTNLSSGGMRFAFKPPVRTADLCLILLRLPGDDRPICVLAEVVWVAKLPVEAPQAGMQFINMTEDDQHRLRQFVRNHEKEVG